MTFGSILMLAVGLAMDATAVAAARGVAVSEVRLRHLALVAVFFGGFQALMPLLGWVIGGSLGPFVQAWEHWIAFALLTGIGGKMLWEARSATEVPKTDDELFDTKVLLLLAVATSIDALAAGITLSMLAAPCALSLATIGVVTAVLSALGLIAGHRFGRLLGQKLDLVGGLILIGLGVKILIEHFRGA